MILGKEVIKQEIEQGNIILKSPRRGQKQLLEQVTTESIDVTLGESLYQVKRNLTLKRDDQIMYDEYKCVKYEKWEYNVGIDYVNSYKLRELKNGQKMLFAPGTCLLCYTDEFVGTKAGSKIHPEFHSTSTVGRHFLFHTKAGFGDEGYINRWAMEFVVMQPILLQPGMVVGQVSFYRKDGSSDYVEGGGQYQETNNIEELMKNWSVESIKPKKHLKAYG